MEIQARGVRQKREILVRRRGTMPAINQTDALVVSARIWMNIFIVSRLVASVNITDQVQNDHLYVVAFQDPT